MRRVRQLRGDPAADSGDHLAELGDGAVACVRHEFDLRVAAASKDERVVLWDVDVVGAVDDEHRCIAALIEQGSQRERGHQPCELAPRGLVVQAGGVGDDVCHPELPFSVTGERRLDRSAQHDCCVDDPDETAVGREVAAHREPEVRDRSRARGPQRSTRR